MGDANALSSEIRTLLELYRSSSCCDVRLTTGSSWNYELDNRLETPFDSMANNDTVPEDEVFAENPGLQDLLAAYGVISLYQGDAASSIARRVILHRQDCPSLSVLSKLRCGARGFAEAIRTSSQFCVISAGDLRMNRDVRTALTAKALVHGRLVHAYSTELDSIPDGVLCVLLYHLLKDTSALLELIE